MSVRELDQLREHFGSWQRELYGLRKVFLGGYHQDSVQDLIARMEREFEETMAQAREAHAEELQALQAKLEDLLRENQGYDACLEGICDSLSSLSRSLLTLLEQQRQRDEELKAYQRRERRRHSAAGTGPDPEPPDLELLHSPRVITPNFCSS